MNQEQLKKMLLLEYSAVRDKIILELSMLDKIPHKEEDMYEEKKSSISKLRIIADDIRTSLKRIEDQEEMNDEVGATWGEKLIQELTAI